VSCQPREAIQPTAPMIPKRSAPAAAPMTAPSPRKSPKSTPKPMHTAARNAATFRSSAVNMVRTARQNRVRITGAK
jgi:hypothetical protein